MRLLADPARRPNDVWTEITRATLGIAPHPEWSWWAIRGQLVQEPGYMANYAVGRGAGGAIRARIREARGDWMAATPAGTRGSGTPLPVRAGAVGRRGRPGVLGGPPTADALVAEIARALPPVPSGLTERPVRRWSPPSSSLPRLGACCSAARHRDDGPGETWAGAVGGRACAGMAGLRTSSGDPLAAARSYWPTYPLGGSRASSSEHARDRDVHVLLLVDRSGVRPALT